MFLIYSHLHVIFTDPPEAEIYGPASAGFKACPRLNPKFSEKIDVFVLDCISIGIKICLLTRNNHLTLKEKP